MIAVVFADGFEEIEALTVVDILTRAGNDVVKVGLDSMEVVGAHNVCVKMDVQLDQGLMQREWEMLVLPGGPGTMRLNASDDLLAWLKAMHVQKKKIAAICAAPLVLSTAGLLEGKTFTCYPGTERQIVSGTHTEEGVVVDGNLITGRSPGKAMDFALMLVSVCNGTEKSKIVEKGLVR